MISRTQHAKNRVDASHPGGKCVSAVAIFKFGESALQCLAVRMVGARVIVALIFPQLLVDVRGCLIDGRDDGSGGRIRFLSDVNSVSGEAHGTPSRAKV